MRHFKLLRWNTHEEWLKIREKHISGTDLGIILGVNKYKKTMKLYEQKKKGISDNIDNEAVRFGKAAETPLVQLYLAMHPELELKKLYPKYTLQSIKRPWQIANVDGVCKCRITKERHGLEIKTATVVSLEEWTEQIPNSYYSQCLHYMSVTGFEKWVVFALIKHIDFQGKIKNIYLREYKIQRDGSELAYLEHKEFEFYDSLTTGKINLQKKISI